MMLDDAMPALSGKSKSFNMRKEDSMGIRIAPSGRTLECTHGMWYEDVPKVTRLSRCTYS